MVLLINFYQRFLSPLLLQLLGIPSICRFEITCSEYAKQAIKQHGSIKGSWMGLVRLIHCQPFYQSSVLSGQLSEVS